MIDARHFEGAGIRAARAPSLAASAMVASPSAWATLVGLEVLRDGGSAVDASIAVSAALMVAQPHQCTLGGDAFWLVRPPGGVTHSLNASGRTPAAADAAALRAAGLDAIPSRSAYAVTVPGVVSGWIEAHARFGALDFERLLGRAIEGAEHGLPVTPLFARQLKLSQALLAARPVSRRVFLPHGRSPRVGERFAQPDLARTLRLLARDPRGFYEGELAERTARALDDEDGWTTPDDLAAHQADWADPVSLPWRGLNVEETPPNSQGITALLALALLEAGPAPRSAVERVHLSIEAAKIAMLVRDAEVGDPEAMRRSPEELLGDKHVEALAALLSTKQARPRSWLRSQIAPNEDVAPAAAARGDTAYFAIVDSGGLTVSCIQSVFEDFGCGIVVPETGIALHNRGSEFRLNPGHVNSLKPRKRPLHTLAAAIATASSETAALFGTMGGHAQTQIHVQMLEGFAVDGLDPATIIARPRWFAPPDEHERTVLLEERHPLAGELAALGHDVQLVAPYEQMLGHAQMILIDHERGVLVGASDPRSDGAALGF